LAAFSLVLSFLLPGVATAADDQDERSVSASTQQPRSAPDFLFGEPHGSFGVRGSWVFARAGSELFRFIQRQLTINDGDFNGPALAADVGIVMTPRLDAVIGFEFSQARTESEYRDFVDRNRLPITQETMLREANLSGSIRIALTPRGRRVSRLAWIPRTLAPYAGAGGGFLWYRFQQRGDFIDVFDPRLRVFHDTIASRGWGPSAHAFGGMDVKLYRRLYLALEGRYLWASAPLERTFEDFDPIDLAGFRLAAGINVLF
jgi:hypothetical protein